MFADYDGILVTPGFGEFRIAFNENLYRVDPEQIKNRSTASVLAGDTTGFDLDQIDYGNLVCYYNPVRISPFRAVEATRKMVEYIKSCRVEP